MVDALADGHREGDKGEDDGGDQHNDKDDPRADGQPEIDSSTGRIAYQRVLLPESSATSHSTEGPGCTVGMGATEVFAASTAKAATWLGSMIMVRAGLQL